MGEETIELLLRHNKGIMPKHEKSQTQKFNLIGSYSKIEAIRGLQLPNEQLFNQYEDHLVLTRDLPRDVAKHLVHTYGTSSLRVVDVGDQNEKKRVSGTNQRIHPDYPFLRSEVSYSARHELAQKPNDILCRRVPIAFLNKEVTEDLLPEVVEILAREHSWSSSKKAEELKEAKENLKYLK